MLVSFIVISLVYLQAIAEGKTFSLRQFGYFLLYFPLFLSVSMGMALHNAVAVWEGWSGRKSAFIRTPKYNLENQQQRWQLNFNLNIRRPFTTYVEGSLGLLFLGVSIWSISQKEYGLLAFHLMLAFGYLYVFFSTFQSHSRI